MSELTSLIEIELPSGETVAVARRRFGDPTAGKRAAIVAGIRGDAPEGVRVAYLVAAFLAEHEDALAGAVDIYPCVNPLAAERGSRRWPSFDVDLNRRFPGREDGHPPDQTAYALCQDVRGADQVIELRGARPSFQEATQAHVSAHDPAVADLAQGANVAVIWKRSPGPAAPSTFAHQFKGTIVLEGGSGNRLTTEVGRDLRDGVLNLLCGLKILPETLLPFHWAALSRPVTVEDAQVHRVRAGRSGLFMPQGQLWAEVQAGDPLGVVIEPTTGEPLETLVSPSAGRLMALREHPTVFPGTMVARVVVV
ncbi:MAG: succinylglutamate desuccinylase/aspartoacylase family protein [Myxococcota bacterium]